MTNALAIVTTDTDHYIAEDSDSTTRLCNEALLMMQQFDRAVHQASIVLGQKLIEVKARLPHGAFRPWLEAANWESRTANRLMTVAKELGTKSDTLSHIPRTLLYTIAKLPADMREDVLTLIIDPEHPPLTAIKTRIDRLHEAKGWAKFHKMQDGVAGPSELAQKRHANKVAKAQQERKVREDKIETLALTFAEILNSLSNDQRAAIDRASQGLDRYEQATGFRDALDLMDQPATVEPMPTPKQLDDSDDIAVEVTELDVTAA
tara:strand:- start:240 stop:1028 length:789 start_codon:yes stop_codon:yes gene_type:complete